jgi:hypothetical protein
LENIFRKHRRLHFESLVDHDATIDSEALLKIWKPLSLKHKCNLWMNEDQERYLTVMQKLWIWTSMPFESFLFRPYIDHNEFTSEGLNPREIGRNELSYLWEKLRIVPEDAAMVKEDDKIWKRMFSKESDRPIHKKSMTLYSLPTIQHKRTLTTTPPMSRLSSHETIQYSALRTLSTAVKTTDFGSDAKDNSFYTPSRLNTIETEMDFDKSGEKVKMSITPVKKVATTYEKDKSLTINQLKIH